MLHGTQASTFLHYSALYRFGGKTFFNTLTSGIHSLNEDIQEFVLLLKLGQTDSGSLYNPSYWIVVQCQLSQKS
jgi:hypothetical protein